MSLYLLLLLVVPVAILVLYSVWTAGFFTVVRRLTPANYQQVFENPSVIIYATHRTGCG